MVMVNQIIHLGVGIENSQTDILSSPRACPPSASSIHSSGRRMEESLQQEKESEYKDPNEDQGNFLKKIPLFTYSLL